jgi:transglutaminase-like putative cysteine protease
MQATSVAVPSQEGGHWAVRLTKHLVEQLRPHLGWSVLVLAMFISVLPALALDVHDWLRSARLSGAVRTMGPLAVTLMWLVLGWRRPRREEWRWWQTLLLYGGLMLLGALVLSQLFLRWIPGPVALVEAARSGDFAALGARVTAQLGGLGARFALWWQGVRAGGAAQDDVIFASGVGLLFWLAGLITAWIAYRRRNGFLAALLPLWLTINLLALAREGRLVILTGLIAVLFLHLLLDQAKMVATWRARGWDFHTDLIVDRLVAVAAVTLALLAAGIFAPSLRVRPISDWYYRMMEPVDTQVDAITERLFPDYERTSRSGLGGVGGGLPNEFLLRGGPELGNQLVMRVRTSDVVSDAPFDGAPPPQGHYMRGATFSEYDGLGWDNSLDQERISYPANARWTEADWQGRRLVIQSVNLTFNSGVIYAAPEPVEPSIDYRAQTRGEGDLTALYARTDSYAVASLVPAVSEEQLAAAAPWTPVADDPLAVHLALPDTVTERTRALVDEITAGLDTPYAKALALERYLRQFEYDLTVTAPPATVTDVADFFLFDLQRGYCDYYATAFVVMARLAGLPARFATGFAMGEWDSYNRFWIVTEAEAHSWPEVYFPAYGWIPFEPTAGRPELARIGLPEQGVGAPLPATTPTVTPIETADFTWSWQMLFWLLPLGFVVWGAVAFVSSWRAQREDPWLALLNWGGKAGRPMAQDETASEYGRDLAAYVLAHGQAEAGTGRHVAGEIRALSGDVTTAQYGPDDKRAEARARIATRWPTLRSYLRRLRLRKDD